MPIIGDFHRDLGNFSKIFQLDRLNHHGFSVPDYLATNDIESAKKFIERKSQTGCIYKSISSTRSIVSEVDSSNFDRLSLLPRCPVLFQEKIVGPDVRVHCIGEDVFAEMIESSAVDYRYSKSFHSKEIHICESLRDLMASYLKERNAFFAGFDCKICQKIHAFICLEANPMPGYEGYDIRSKEKISEALPKLLRNINEHI